MRDLPLPIRDFILSLTDEMLSPAYLLVTENGQLIESGGDLESYGLKELRKDVDVNDHVSFLVGVLPLESKNLFLPKVETKPGVYADVYVFSREQGNWVLLLDSTAERDQRQKMQQKLYDSRLQVTNLAREGDALYEANAVLEQMVRERTAELSQTILELRQQISEIERVRKASQQK
jgi:adenylate cyclase